jgi:hypothetical protein
MSCTYAPTVAEKLFGSVRHNGGPRDAFQLEG